TALPEGNEDLREFRRSGIRSVQSTPLFSRAGHLVGMVSTHWREPHTPKAPERRLLDIMARQAADLIERVKAEQALRDAAHAKDDFLAVLSHELRNPLAALQMGLELLKRHPERVEAVSGMMERQFSHLVRLVDDLLDLSRIS